jgi:hypothetical protein
MADDYNGLALKAFSYGKDLYKKRFGGNQLCFHFMFHVVSVGYLSLVSMNRLRADKQIPLKQQERGAES